MAKVANTNLHDAKKHKKDEFYTQLSDIENELKHYKEHFKDKIVYCNCDDPLQSAFFEYFFKNFKWLDLKALITTCYKSQNYREVSSEDSPKKAYAIKIHRDDVIKDELINPQKHSIEDIDKVLSQMHPLSEVEATSLSLSRSKSQSPETLKAFEENKHKLFDKFRAELESGLPKESTQNKNTKSPKHPSLFEISEDKGLNNAGDFRSKDCIELLKLADIVVTNPPFSLFREYVAQLVEYGKKFLIIGNKNAITYKETFSLIKENKVWLGITRANDFLKPNENHTGFILTKQVSGLTRWFSNLTHKKRNEILETIHSYAKTPEKYPKYDNYDAINVDEINKIPMDYDGVMGVPITFLDKHNPKQFEVVAKMTTTGIDEFNFGYPYINGKKTYARILIRKIAEVDDLRKEEENKRS
nr:adenine-specific methyltransferase EcoRI family protein [Campylobacter upsaliensis]